MKYCTYCRATQLMCRTYERALRQRLSTGNHQHVPDCNRVQHPRCRSAGGNNWIAMYVDSKRHGDYFDPYGLQPQHIEFTNFMNEHCSEWAPNDRTLQSPLSTVCGQYCVAFLLFRCRNVSMHVFTRRLFTTDLVANDCRVFDWVAAVNKK